MFMHTVILSASDEDALISTDPSYQEHCGSFAE
jgi:hypothetical protein